MRTDKNEYGDFFTPVALPTPSFSLTARSVICGIGSCFAEEVLKRLFELGVKGGQNPNGIVYNAVSICEILSRVASNSLYSKSDFFLHDGLWHRWLHHGSFSFHDIDCAVEAANKSMLSFRDNLASCSSIIITPASSVVYEYVPENRIVANCHKVPNKMFARKLLSVEDNFRALHEMSELILEFNPECRIIFTLSPVRHYPGELVLNSRSKANLLSAIHMCVDRFGGKLVYFPSYEMMMDEFRDYRFYKEDMLHPSEFTVKIIFERFLNIYFDEESVKELKENAMALKRTEHRPFHS